MQAPGSTCSSSRRKLGSCSSWLDPSRAFSSRRSKNSPSSPLKPSESTGKDILKLVGAGRVETIWKTLDAALAGQPRLALEHFDTLITGGEEPVGMLAAMSANLMKLHFAGHYRAQRISVDEACRLAGIPSFAVDKTRKQHAHLGPSRVDQLPASLERADLDLKGGSTLDPRIILERFLIGLALPQNRLTASHNREAEPPKRVLYFPRNFVHPSFVQLGVIA